jgi:hypothetical protein
VDEGILGTRKESKSIWSRGQGKGKEEKVRAGKVKLLFV